MTDNLSNELSQGYGSSNLPPTVENVKRTCRRCAESPDTPVRIDMERLESFVATLDLDKVKRSSHLMDIPLEFPDLHAAVNLHLALHLFNFGHGFRHPLHRLCGQGAWQTMKRGLLAMHTGAEQGFIDADTLLRLTSQRVDALFDFPPPGSLPDAEELAPLRNMILLVAHTTGQRLLDLRHPSLADFLFAQASDGASTAPKLVQTLAENFPAFDDRRDIGQGQEVLFLKKAQLAITELYQKHEDSLSDKLPFSGIRELTVACDNVLPCVLRTLGILKLPPNMEQYIDQRLPLPAGEQEARLRAIAITATEIILEKSEGAFWSKELGDFLWTLGKDPRFRRVERHATRDTCFY